MENFNQRKGNWWCIYFTHETMEETVAKRLKTVFHQVTPHVVFGHKRVFLDVSKSKWRRSLPLFRGKLAKIAEKHGLNPEGWQWGVGKTLAESWVHSKWKTLFLDALPIEAISDFLNPFENHRKSNNESRRFRVLRSLSVDSLQDLAEIPEDVLLSQCGVWIAEFTRDHFAPAERARDTWLEQATADSFLRHDGVCEHRFRLEDWIPDEYLEVG